MSLIDGDMSYIIAVLLKVDPADITKQQPKINCPQTVWVPPFELELLLIGIGFTIRHKPSNTNVTTIYIQPLDSLLI